MAFKLKDGSGVEHTYDQTKLKIPSTTEGETVVFTEGEVQLSLIHISEPTRPY